MECNEACAEGCRVFKFLRLAAVIIAVGVFVWLVRPSRTEAKSPETVSGPEGK